MLGETVIAIGNPLGLGHSITTGIVSSVKRRVNLGNHFSSVFIQTDALINPGNSGGPLINVNGELVGINTAIARQAQGIGFSIPIDTAKRILNDLVTYGRVRHGFMGIDIGGVSSSFVRSFGESGVLVEEVVDSSPAEKAGLQVADVILSVDGVPVADAEQYLSLMQTYTPDDTLVLELLRGRERLQQQIKLSRLPDGYEMTYTRDVFGFDLTERRQGLFVESIAENSAAAAVGLQRGDMIAKVAGVKVENLAAYKQVIEAHLGRKPLTFTVIRNNYAYLVELP